MRSLTFELKVNDRWPTLRVRVLDQARQPIDLTGVAATFSMRPSTGGALKVSAAPAAIVVDATGALSVLKYVWSAGDTDTAGMFHAQFDLTMPDGSPASAPNDTHLLVRINPRA